MKTLKYILIGLICLLGITLIVNLYLYWKATVNDNHGYNSINALIALIGLLVNIITIFFLYFNYQQQQKHINKQEEELKRNRQDVEFNKVVQLVQNQIVITKQLEEKLPKTVETILDKNNLDYHIIKLAYERIIFLDKQLILYKRFLHYNLKLNDKETIFSIICTNFLDNHIDYIQHIINLYERVTTTDIKNIVTENYNISYSFECVLNGIKEVQTPNFDFLNSYYNNKLENSKNKLNKIGSKANEFKIFYDLQTSLHKLF